VKEDEESKKASRKSSTSKISNKETEYSLEYEK
jgi:hypothetical protein